jgi:class 3 adenylate cyclase
MASLSREELFKLLERRIADPSIAASVEHEVWSRCGAERAIFVSDLSGFTRLTRKHGILHFLTVYRRASNLGTPLLERHHGRCVKREADNLIYSFHRVSDAVAAAREIVAATTALDAELPEDERVYPCIGIGFGRVIELTDDVFGDEVNVAFKLGEDIATKREVLLSEGALEQLRREGVEVTTEERRDELGGVLVRYYVLR